MHVIFFTFCRYLFKTLKLFIMKTTATPKDVLFVTMLSITCLVGYIGFSQSAKYKSQNQHLSHTEIQTTRSNPQGK